MRSGQQRNYIKIQQRQDTKTSSGAVIPGWNATSFVETWADMQYVARRGSRSAWESFISQQIRAQRVVMFVIRYYAGIDETMRILDPDGKVWDIKSIVDVDNRHRELWLFAEYGLTQGA